MNNHTTASTKSILTFIVLTLGLTWVMEIALITGGMRFDDMTKMSEPAMWLLAIMLIPGTVAVLVTRFIEGVGFREMFGNLNLRFGGTVMPYLGSMIAIPAVFAAIYGMSWALGITEYAPRIPGMTGEAASEVDVYSLLTIALPASIVAGPFINLIFGLGEEIGWRGFLLPRLMVLGKHKAYILVGLIWGLWHAPLVYAGFNYPGYPLVGIAMMCLLSIAFGYFINELTLHYKSTILAGFIHGAFNAQGFGIWLFLFPDANPLLGSPSGIVGAAYWLLAGLIAANKLRADHN